MTREPTYGLIGRGRVATHLAHYLRLEGQPVSLWHRGLGTRPENTLSDSDVVLLAIRDDALAPFVERQVWLHDRTAVHFSGCLVLRSVVGLHPAMTFGPELYDLRTYREIPFVEERGRPTFADIFPGLRNFSWPLDPEAKPLYHALCVLGGNGMAGLASVVLDQFEMRLGLPRKVLEPLMERSLGNALSGGLRSMTGPWVRGDAGTVESNLESLRGSPLEEIYWAVNRAIRVKGNVQ